MKRIVLFCILVVLPSGILRAVPPRDPGVLKNLHGITPCHTMSPSTFNALQMRGALRMATAQGLLAPTTYHILVIRVEFSEVLNRMPADPESLQKAQELFERFKQFYWENSYGMLTASATITTQIFRLGSLTSYVPNDTPANAQKLFDDSMNAVKNSTWSGVNFDTVDHIIVYHADWGAEETGDANHHIWSLWTTVTPRTYDGYSESNIFDNYLTAPAEVLNSSSTLGVMCHEYGHQLGLPDLYSTDAVNYGSTCGAWSLMDYPYGADGEGDNPPHLDPWSKDYLQFIDLDDRVITATTAGSLAEIETSQGNGFYKIPIEIAPSTEYFIVEYRNKNSTTALYDKSMPGSGLLIWHIDDAIARSADRLSLNNVNTGQPHLGIDLVERDGYSNYQYGDPAGSAGSSFIDGSNFVTPLTDTFSGLRTPITLSNISLTGASAGCTISKIAAASILAVNKIISYPNPAGKGYPHPRQGSGTLATISLKSNKAPGRIKLDIYTMSGELVREADERDFNINFAVTSDFNWIFEFDWNGKNDRNENVAPGLYFYRVKADSETRVGKMAIVR